MSDTLQDNSFVTDDGWKRFNTWGQSAEILALYRARAEGSVEEMTCAGQAAEVYQSIAENGESLLDIGCGAGHFYRSLRARSLHLDYYGIDPTEAFIRVGREALADLNLPPERLQTIRIEDLYASTDHVLCMNVLSYLDGFRRPLERLLNSTRKTLLLRESFYEEAKLQFIEDHYLDKGPAKRVNVNTYALEEVCDFIDGLGFKTTFIEDRYSNGSVTMSVDIPHYWTFILCERRDA